MAGPSIDFSDLDNEGGLKPTAPALPGLSFEDAPTFGAKPQAPPPPTAASGWGPGLHLLDAMLLRYGPQLATMPSGSMEAASVGMPSGPEPSKADRAKEIERLEQAREDWTKEHPTAALATELAGSAVPATAALLGQEYALAPFAARLAALGPRALQLINVLRGTAGAERAGLGGVAARAGSRAVRGAIEGGESVAAEKKVQGKPVTFEDIEGGALAGGAFNPLLRGIMPRAREMDVGQALMRQAFGAPVHHVGAAARVGEAGLSGFRRMIGEARASPIMGLIGAASGLGGMAEGYPFVRHAMEMLPEGVAAPVAGTAAIAGAGGTLASRIMGSDWYRNRILRGATGQGVYPFSRVNPLTPFATAPLTQLGPQQ